ncbi:hypothetical protein CSUI_006696 [Cystoisospora suis]|uniref:Transmembrane protein n=1 Tax=Cystoisospora suis TaxID=483139 RepID=A0A2C6KTL2_9APIC|nr:hypothetical protein CSUI_006696 [Cystoisospora suis]
MATCEREEADLYIENELNPCSEFFFSPVGRWYRFVCVFGFFLPFLPCRRRCFFQRKHFFPVFQFHLYIVPVLVSLVLAACPGSPDGRGRECGERPGVQLGRLCKGESRLTALPSSAWRNGESASTMKTSFSSICFSIFFFSFTCRGVPHPVVGNGKPVRWSARREANALSANQAQLSLSSPSSYNLFPVLFASAQQVRYGVTLDTNTATDTPWAAEENSTTVWENGELGYVMGGAGVGTHVQSGTATAGDLTSGSPDGTILKEMSNDDRLGTADGKSPGPRGRRGTFLRRFGSALSGVPGKGRSRAETRKAVTKRKALLALSVTIAALTVLGAVYVKLRRRKEVESESMDLDLQEAFQPRMRKKIWPAAVQASLLTVALLLVRYMWSDNPHVPYRVQVEETETTLGGPGWVLSPEETTDLALELLTNFSMVVFLVTAVAVARSSDLFSAWKRRTGDETVDDHDDDTDDEAGIDDTDDDSDYDDDDASDVPGREEPFGGVSPAVRREYRPLRNNLKEVARSIQMIFPYLYKKMRSVLRGLRDANTDEDYKANMSSLVALADLAQLELLSYKLTRLKYRIVAGFVQAKSSFLRTHIDYYRNSAAQIRRSAERHVAKQLASLDAESAAGEVGDFVRAAGHAFEVISSTIVNKLNVLESCADAEEINEEKKALVQSAFKESDYVLERHKRMMADRVNRRIPRWFSIVWKKK